MGARRTTIGSLDATPGVMGYPSTLYTGPDTFPGLTIEQHPTAPASQVALRLVDATGDTLMDIPWDAGANGGPRWYNMKLGATPGVFTAAVFLNGQEDPPCIEFPNGMRLWGGTGVPAAGKVGNARIGDWYLRRDTPTVALQRIYRCIAAGNPGTWGGIA